MGLASLTVAFASSATTVLNVGLSSQDVLGEVVLNGVYTAPSGGQETRDLAMINQLVGIYNGTIVQAAPYYLSANNFGSPPLPQAVTTGDVITPNTGIHFAADGNVTITLTSSYQYLIAAYDGKNAGAVVWDISGLQAGTTIEFTRYAQPNASGTDLVDGTSASQYGITTWSLFNPGTARVPDGGSTVALMGAGLAGLALLRRKLC